MISIVENIKMIVMTRRGSLVHLKKFGVPDVRSKMTFNKHKSEWIQAFNENIKRYEKRLTVLNIEEDEEGGKDGLLSLQISCREMKGETRRFLVMLSVFGSVHIREDYGSS